MASSACHHRMLGCELETCYQEPDSHRQGWEEGPPRREWEGDFGTAGKSREFPWGREAAGTDVARDSKGGAHGCPG